MSARGPAVAIGIAVALAAAAAGSVRAQERTLRDGVYSAEQAVRGKARYASACAACHLADLTGTLAGDAGAPPLRGEAFVSFIEGWDARRLFEYMKTTMPADDPASLSDTAYLDVLSYLFQANGFPAGPVDLDIERLSAIHLTGNP
jgi:mono/diheme cytochrome c family protein